MPAFPAPCRSLSEQETELFGEQVAGQARPNCVFALTGELGAGKTCFVRGFCRGLGSAETVLSPTFALLHVYRGGALPVFHYDAYRIQNEAEGLETGIEECFTAGGVCLIEWAEKIRGLLPADTVWIRFTHAGEKAREIEIMKNEEWKN